MRNAAPSPMSRPTTAASTAVRAGVGSIGVGGDLGRLDDGGTAGAQCGVDAELVECGVEVGELGDEPGAAGVVVGECVEFGLEFVDGASALRRWRRAVRRRPARAARRCRPPRRRRRRGPRWWRWRRGR